MSLNDTPRADRLHIGIFGRRNAGKSSLINALTGQETALVSAAPGTTTDPVYKSMELHPIGPVVFIDTAGFDDEGELGKLRVERTEAVLERTDVAVMVIDAAEIAESEESRGCAAGEEVAGETISNGTAGQRADTRLLSLEYENHWAERLAEKDIPVIFALNKCDVIEDDIKRLEKRVCVPADGAENDAAAAMSVSERTKQALRASLKGIADPVIITVSAAEKAGIVELRDAIAAAVPEDFLRRKILGDMIAEGGLALLVMPQDIQAPKGRLILPQVQTLRELLDRKCTAVSTTADGLERALAALGRAPDLIITDSQCFRQVYDMKPEESALTSFSVLFAAYKGDIDKFTAGASRLDDMTERSKVLIAEACTHVPLSEDIGRVKIPALLRKRFGEGLEIVNVCGSDFPPQEQLRDFDLIIHCGACMFNRKHVMSRIAAAEAAGVPITNYGVVLAKLSGILDKVQLPDGG